MFFFYKSIQLWDCNINKISWTDWYRLLRNKSHRLQILKYNTGIWSRCLLSKGSAKSIIPFSTFSDVYSHYFYVVVKCRRRLKFESEFDLSDPCPSNMLKNCVKIVEMERRRPERSRHRRASERTARRWPWGAAEQRRRTPSTGRCDERPSTGAADAASSASPSPPPPAVAYLSCKNNGVDPLIAFYLYFPKILI